MPAHNEAVFVLHLCVGAGLLLAAARLGRAWVVLFVALCTILMNLAVFKSMPLLGMPATGGNVEYALVFLANDLLNEHYGPRHARRAVRFGFAAGLVVVVLMQFVLWYRPAADDTAQPHLWYLFGVAAYPRIVAASMASYLLSQYLDTWLYHGIRRRTGPRLLWLRSNGSTVVAQAFDTLFFTTAGLVGVSIHTWQAWGGAVLVAYAVKVLAAILATPFLYLSLQPGCRPRGSRR